MRDAADVNSLVGTVVEDRYCVELELGAGAMGTVYRGRHIKVGRTVAIKVLHDHLVQDATMVERFEREAMNAARLKHPNLVAVIDLGLTPTGKRCMVLEFAPGRCLADLVSRAMPRERVIDLTRQLLCGLEHAHAIGLVHRDLKPENVLVEEHADGRSTPRIVDFGIAVLRDTDDAVTEGRRLTVTGSVLGTPMYMAPEQARGESVDHRADLFALGVIVYELLAGKPPFEGSGVEIMMLNMVQDPPSVATRAGIEVDPLLETFARKLMARERSDRFTTARAALEVLELVDSDRDAAARALGLGTCVPGLMREHDAIVTRRHVVSMALAPLTRMEIAPRVENAPQRDVQHVVEDARSPGRPRWGTFVGAAAIIGVALLIVVMLANAARAHGSGTQGGGPGHPRGNSPVQPTGGCSDRNPRRGAEFDREDG